MIHTSLANYETEQALFSTLVASDTGHNILLFQGESGSGKSHLIEYCLNTVPHIPSVLMKLQSGAEAIPGLLALMGGQRGWENLAHLTHIVANLLGQPENVDNPLWQVGMHRHLREIGRISDMESRLTRYRLLADAWFTDAATFEVPFLLAVDAYENSSMLFDQWFSQEFLVGAANCNRMRVLVGGQTVPSIQSEWSFCASLHELKGVQKAEEWLAWATETGYQIPSLEIMIGVVLALKGNPSRIIEVIKTQFPKSNSPIKTKERVYNQRKQIRENMIQAFTLEDLKNICFDMEINYESLPDHDQLDSFVRELLAYTSRIGRLNELIQLCQTERPYLDW